MHTQPSISATVRAMLLVLVGAVGLQIGAAISISLFDALTVTGTSGLRMLVGAVIMLLVLRPRLRGRSREEWLGIVLYGVAMAAMNQLLYQAIARLPLGVAMTLDFLGPCMIALLASRRVREGFFAIAAFAGVVLMVGFGGPFDPLGIMWGLLAGASFAGYTFLAPRVGRAGGGLQGVALSLGVAAILTLPFSLPVISHAALPQWGLLAVSALIGTVLPVSVDAIAGRLTSAKTLGVFFAFDPLMATIVGTLFVGQAITPAALGGILLVVLAGAGIVWSAGRNSGEQPGSAGRSSASGAPEAASVGADRGAESLEVERKYEVNADTDIPDAEAFRASGLSTFSPETHELRARYFDTPEGALAQQAIAMRVREGGADAGWHVKTKGAGGARELHWPLADTMPEGLVAELRSRIGDDVDRVQPIAELRTERRILRLADPDGVEVVELADDRVFAADLRGTSPVERAWREWEAELIQGADERWLDVVGQVLVAAGARPSASPAKIARATGTLIALAKSRGAAPETIAQLEEMDRLDQAAARRLGA